MELPLSAYYDKARVFSKETKLIFEIQDAIECSYEYRVVDISKPNFRIFKFKNVVDKITEYNISLAYLGNKEKSKDVEHVISFVFYDEYQSDNTFHLLSGLVCDAIVKTDLRN